MFLFRDWRKLAVWPGTTTRRLTPRTHAIQPDSSSHLRPGQPNLRSAGPIGSPGDIQSALRRSPDAIAPFAELEKSPEHIHTYRISNLSLWNAAAAGFTAKQMIAVLTKFTSSALPANIPSDIEETVSRYGRVKLERREEGHLRLHCDDKALLEELARQPKVRSYLGDKLDASSYAVDAAHRGVLKLALIQVGYPAEDLAGYVEGTPLPTNLPEMLPATACRSTVRDYQLEAADIYYAGGDVRGGSGVIVLPCGSGKTIVGIAAMAAFKNRR